VKARDPAAISVRQTIV